MPNLLRRDKSLTLKGAEAHRRRVMRSTYLASVMVAINARVDILTEKFALDTPFFTVNFSEPGHVIVSFHSTQMPEAAKDKPKYLLSNQRLHNYRMCWGRVAYARRASKFLLSRVTAVTQQALVNPHPELRLKFDLGEYNPSNVDLESIFYGSEVSE